ncbi:MAG: ESPR domain-containing protein, partial [Moraxella equi]|nr:ESPR domain-containing protein [Moraxella equi]
MNHIYRVVFNHATGTYQCVSEFAKAKGKTKSIKALAVASSLVVSGISFGANIEFTDGQTHTIEGNRAFDGKVLISNPNTKVTIKGQLVFGNGDDTDATISNQAVVESNNDIAISAGQNATVVVDNASLANKSGILALGLTPSNTAKLIGRNGAKITASGIVSIANIDNGTATVELTGKDTVLSGTVINVGEQSGAKGTLTLSDKANVNAEQLLIGRSNKATGTLNANNASINTDSMAVGVYGNGVAELTSSNLNLSDSYILADGQGSTADVGSANSTILAQSAVIATTGSANLNSSNDTYRIQKSLIVGQMAGSKGDVSFENSDMSVKDMNLGIFDGSQADVVIKGSDSNFQIDNELIIANGGTGSLTLDKTSLYHVGNVRAGAVYVGGGSDGGTAGTQGGTGTLTLKDSTLVTKEVIVGNTGSGTLRLEAENTDDYLTGLYTNQISRNTASQQSDIYINGAEVGITADQPNLFANFTKDNKIELGNKGVYFETANVQSGTNVTINPNAVLTGHVGAININSSDDSAGFWKSGAGTLEINENSKKFTGDIAVAQGVLKINGNYTMNGENLLIGIFDDNEDGVLDTASEYGKLVVTGVANIANGSLKVYAEELIADTPKDSVWRDVVSAGTLKGQFVSLDDNSPLVDFEADYSDANKVHLKWAQQGSTPTPTIVGTFETAVKAHG